MLPDALLVSGDSTPKDLAFEIHTEIGKRFAFAIDARTGRRLSSNDKLSHRMVVKIVTSH